MDQRPASATSSLKLSDAFAPLFLRTLGSPALLRPRPDAEPELLLEPSKLLALVTYLALAPGRTATRDGLVDLLWADLDPEAGRHSVRQTLWQLKRKLGADLVVEGRDQLVLKTSIDSDRAQFVAASEQADFARAVQLYTGEFFPGFAGSGAGEFERWVDGERWELRSRFLRCAEVVVRDLLNANRSREAVALARRIREADPLRQHGWRILLEALLAAHDPVSAAVECDSLERLLAQEGGAPEPATKGMIAAVRRAGTAVSDAVEAPRLQPELVGREREFATLMSAWERAGRGTPVHVTLTAQAGMGKTRLLSEFHARLQSMRVRCVTARGNAGATTVPFALAADLAEKLGALPGARGVSPDSMRILVALSPALSSAYNASPLASSPSDAVRHRLSAMKELVSAVAAERPVAILVDDVHWADAASREVLDSLFGALNDAPVLACIASRPVEGVAPTGSTQVQLEPLSEATVFALVSSLASLPLAAWADRFIPELTRRTRGVPLYVVETLQLAIEEGCLAIEEGEWRAENQESVWRLLASGGVLRRRLERLDDAERHVLRVLALAATPLSVSDVIAASDGLAHTGPAALAGLQAKGLINTAGGRLRVTHDELASVVIEDVSSAERSRIDRAIGQTLARDTSDGHRMQLAAGHLLRAGAEDELRALFANYFADARRRRDRRRAGILAREMLGEGVDAPTVTRVRRSLPWHVRLGGAGLRHAMVAGIAILIVGVWIGAALPRTSAAPDVLLRAWLSNGSGGFRLVELPLRRDEWNAAEPLRLEGAREILALDGSWQGPPAQSPTGADEWIGERAVTDSGVTDLFLITAGGRRVDRLTHARGDDVSAQWSPDGKSVVFSTTRWDRRGKRDLAILSVADRAVRALTTGPGSDIEPFWSPDGTRIAFARVETDATYRACIATVDGASVNCFRVPGAERFALIGWESDSSVVSTLNSSGRILRTRAVLGATTKFETDSTRPVDGISPDGRWLSGLCPSNDSPVDRCVYPVGRPDLARHVIPSNPLRLAAPRPLEYLDSIAVENGDAQLVLGVPFALSATGFTPAGRRIPARVVSFRVVRPAGAPINDLGEVTATTPGEFLIEVSAGGWRTDTVRMRAVLPNDSTLLTERWDRADTRWRAFGEPLPKTTSTDTGEPSLFLAGDGQFHSGVYLREPLDATRGLALRARVRAPVTRQEWQSVAVVLLTGLDRARMDAWDHRGGYLWNGNRLAGNLADFCGLEYPEASEGPLSRVNLRIHGAGPGMETVGAPEPVRTGAWFEIVVQLLPDRRCGVAVDGEPLGITPPLPTRVNSVYPAFYGNSVDTRILIGPVEIRRGVLKGIDWSRLSQRNRPPQ